jgi:hypothetical protein
MKILFNTLFFTIIILSLPNQINAEEKQDFSNALIIPLGNNIIIENAGKMLRAEILQRTRLTLPIFNKNIPESGSKIFIGTENDFHKAVLDLPVGLEVPGKTDGYSLWVKTGDSDESTIYCVGYDERGALYAVGKLLRRFYMDRDRLLLDPEIQISSAPYYSLRGHQLGTRRKTNSYDAWTIDMWEQYFRDMIVFGMNAVEIVPPKTDDHVDSPLLPLPPMEMMIQMSQLADNYGLDVWIWYPNVEEADYYSDPLVMDYAMREREKVLSQLPRVDAVFVPGGDPPTSRNQIHPEQTIPLMKNMKEILNRYHPDATMWHSFQNFDNPGTPGWINIFLELLRNDEDEWLDGMVFAPAYEITLPELRDLLPDDMPIRRYPDITHTKGSQYPVLDWDPAFQKTLGREPINPRPIASAEIFKYAPCRNTPPLDSSVMEERKNMIEHSIGFITYSEGFNDDVNKTIWSVLGWDPGIQVEDILSEYARYFIGPDYEESFATGIQMLEQNWEGPLKDNEVVYKTLKHFRELENRATMQMKLNPRFQAALYRAYYDAYTKARLSYETNLEDQAINVLKTAPDIGTLKAIERAEEILQKAAVRVKPEWRARIFELAEALFQSIRMQLSVPKYHAKEVNRGANLDLIDVPLNNSRQLGEVFNNIRNIQSEEERLNMIHDLILGNYELEEILHWEKIVEEQLKEANPLWYMRRSADDLEIGSIARLEFKEDGDKMSGLIGYRTNKLDFEDPDPDSFDTLSSLEKSWNGNSKDWVGYWHGYIEAPYTGQVVFSAEVNDGVRLTINETIIIDGLGNGSKRSRSGTIYMQKGKIYPIRIWHYNTSRPSYLRIYWSWDGCSKEIVSPSALFHGPENVCHIKNYME